MSGRCVGACVVPGAAGGVTKCFGTRVALCEIMKVSDSIHTRTQTYRRDSLAPRCVVAGAAGGISFRRRAALYECMIVSDSIHTHIHTHTDLPARRLGATFAPIEASHPFSFFGRLVCPGDHPCRLLGPSTVS